MQDFNVNLENKRKIRTVNSLSHLELATCHSLHFKSDKFGKGTKLGPWSQNYNYIMIYLVSRAAFKIIGASLETRS